MHGALERSFETLSCCCLDCTTDVADVVMFVSVAMYVASLRAVSTVAVFVSLLCRACKVVVTLLDLYELI